MKATYNNVSRMKSHCKLKHNTLHFTTVTFLYCGPGCVVGIVTGYRLDGPGIESRWGGEIFRTCPHQTWGPPSPASCTMGTGSFPGVKYGRGMTLTPHPLLVPWSWKWRAIPLLPLWAVRPVQSLSACTRGALYFFLCFYINNLHEEGFR